MFRGIQFFKPKTNFQRIVWRNIENEPLIHFRLLTVTYGLAPSTFLAVRVLKQLADDHRQGYPVAADDLMIVKEELIGLLAPPRRWNTYVFNRTAEILSDFPRNYWNHVRTEDNLADCASRGLHPSKLLEQRLWWKGPSWLGTPSGQRISKFRSQHVDFGILRIGGRIEQSALNFNAKHPIRIPEDSLLGGLRLLHFHVSHLHTGVDATFANLRQLYWILGARKLIGKTIFNRILNELQTQLILASSILLLYDLLDDDWVSVTESNEHLQLTKNSMKAIWVNKGCKRGT
ncbi:GD15553 [Drosophila simulans]|uniref:GD15553 n=1 Tax=Drosophila simulans TaxID=7240 RepID=B4R2V8_DROSI|nr:GD15553 [Drosophila simulans]